MPREPVIHENIPDDNIHTRCGRHLRKVKKFDTDPDPDHMQSLHQSARVIELTQFSQGALVGLLSGIALTLAVMLVFMPEVK